MNAPEPSPYVKHYGIKPEIEPAFSKHFNESVGRYLKFACTFGIDAAIQRMYDDHGVDRFPKEPTE